MSVRYDNTPEWTVFPLELAFGLLQCPILASWYVKNPNTARLARRFNPWDDLLGVFNVSRNEAIAFAAVL